MPHTYYFYRTGHPFSNFHPSLFVENGVTYRWAEQYLMARKARLFGSEASLTAILAARTPAEGKTPGRRVMPYDDALWREERYGAALNMLRLKFGQNPKLRLPAGDGGCRTRGGRADRPHQGHRLQRTRG